MNTLAIAQPADKDETPLHLNVIGTMALLWSVIGVWRYLSFQSGSLDVGTVSAWGLTPFYDLPSYFMATWGIFVWGSVAGANLLLVRSKLAIPSLIMALLGLMATTAYQFWGAPFITSIYETPFNLAVWIVAHCATLYALRVNAVGLLK